VGAKAPTYIYDIKLKRMNVFETAIQMIQLAGAVTVYLLGIHLLVQSILPKRKRAK
jgi:hypothetical protein